MQTVVGSKGKNGDIGRRPPWGDADGGEEQRRRLKESGEANLRELDPACGGAHPMKSMVAIE
uniref:Uncharacterized protein n=1 Tax=Oryza barthii TaxID=65489 RepID=A0A0D3FSM7_9ORYZ